MLRATPVLIALGLAATGCAAVVGDEPVTLRVMMADDWADTAPVIDAIRQFEEDNPDTTVTVVPRSFSQIPAEAAAAVEAGTPLDVVHHHAFAAGATGVAEPLDVFWDDGTFDLDEHFASAIAGITWGDVRYGVPLDINAMFLMMDEGLAAPDTFDDVARIAEDAAAEGRHGLMVSSNIWEAYGWLRANGGEVVEVAADGSPVFTLDAPENVEALQFLGDLVVADLALGPVSRNTTADSFEAFSEEDTALMTTGTWTAAELARSHPDRAWTATVMPRGTTGDTAGSALGGSSLYVGRGSAHVEEAVALIRALTAPEVALRMAEEERRLPTRPAQYEQLPDSPELATMTAQLESARPMVLIAFPVAEAAFATALDEVITGRADADEALARAQAIAEGADPS